MSTNLGDLVQTDMAIVLDEAVVADVLAKHPFVSVPGTFNVRDLSCNLGEGLRPGYAYRSGTLENVQDPGIVVLRDDLKVKKVFDLRSLKETASFPPPAIEGVDVVWIPSTLDNTTTVIAQDAGRREFSFTRMYLDLLESHAEAYRGVFIHIRDQPDQPFLFHCTAGKDRTGVLAGLIHAVAGTPLSDNDLDYALTRIGVEPVRAFLNDKLAPGKTIDLTDPRMKAYAAVPSDMMTTSLAAVDEKYGSLQNYMTSVLGLSVEDIEQIRSNLVKPST